MYKDCFWQCWGKVWPDGNCALIFSRRAMNKKPSLFGLVDGGLSG
jgi:hypothetical protein